MRRVKAHNTPVRSSPRRLSAAARRGLRRSESPSLGGLRFGGVRDEEEEEEEEEPIDLTDQQSPTQMDEDDAAEAMGVHGECQGRGSSPLPRINGPGPGAPA